MVVLNNSLRNSRAFFFIFAVCLTLQACDRASGQASVDPKKDQLKPESTELILGLCADYPPFEFKKSGEIVGFDVDVAQEISKELGYPLSIQDMDFSALVPALQSGRIDFVMSGMTVTDERKKNLDFSDPYFSSKFALVLPKESSFSQESDFEDKRVGAQLGSTM